MTVETKPFRLRLLGPVQLSAGDGELPVGRPKQRAVLAVLAMRPGAAVTAETLIDRVWGENPPAAVRASMHTYVTRLRALLRTARAETGAPVELVGSAGGYLLQVPAEAVDVHRSRQLAAEARAAVAAGDDESAAGLFKDALRGWGPEPLAGITGDWAARVRNGLERECLAMHAERAEIDLRLGRHRELVSALTEVVAANPTAEPLVVALMEALHRSGATVAALDTYGSLCRALSEQLGIEPGIDARRRHQAILLGGDAAPAHPQRPAAPTVPRQLPRDLPDFTGRENELRAIEDALTGAVAGTPPVVVIHGPGGLGKSTLAVHAAHRLRHRFPDGQLHVDLHGGRPDGAAEPPADVLGRFLRSFGMRAGDVPASTDEAAARFRSELAERRVLVVLDNARDAAQVTLLLPGEGGSTVLVTSRRTLGSLPGVTHIGLSPLSDVDALRFLSVAVGPDRVSADPAAATAVARLCGHQPLALRIAAARLIARPATTMASLADRLADSRRRLDELSTDDIGVRGSVEVSHRELLAGPEGPQTALLFRRLGLLDGSDISVPVAVALVADTAAAERATVERALDRLVEATLVDIVAPGRFGLHDLLRLYAREEAEAREPEESVLAAQLRVVRCYLDGAIEATRQFFPGETRRVPAGPRAASGFAVDSRETAAAWTDAERHNLVTTARWAFAAPDPAPASGVMLTAALLRPFKARGYWNDIIDLRRCAAAVAERLGDLPAQALAIEDVGYVEFGAGRSASGIATLLTALELHRRTGDRVGEAYCLSSIGGSYSMLHRYDEALRYLSLSTALSNGMGHARGEAVGQNLLGLVYQRLGRIDDAVACHDRAVALHASLGESQSMAVALTNLGWAHHRAGRHRAAVGYFERSLDTGRGGVRYDDAENLWGIGQALDALGSRADARVRWRQALDILAEIDAVTPDELALLRRQDPPDTPSIIARNT